MDQQPLCFSIIQWKDGNKHLRTFKVFRYPFRVRVHFQYTKLSVSSPTCSICAISNASANVTQTYNFWQNLHHNLGYILPFMLEKGEREIYHYLWSHTLTFSPLLPAQVCDPHSQLTWPLWSLTYCTSSEIQDYRCLNKRLESLPGNEDMKQKEKTTACFLRVGVSVWVQTCACLSVRHSFNASGDLMFVLDKVCQLRLISCELDLLYVAQHKLFLPLIF